MLITSTQRQVYAELAKILKAADNVIEVEPVGYVYRVDFGAGVEPRTHYVGKDKSCACLLGEDCPAVFAVRDYLRDGGKRAADPEPGFTVTMPAACPICGGTVHHDPRLGSRVRGVGWVCASGGEAHYYRARTTALKKLPRREWLFPPTYDKAGNMLAAGVPLWD